MLTKEELSGTWNDIKGRVKQEWGNISDDELKQVEGSIDRLVGLIQKNTGQARIEIEKTLRSLSEQSAGLLGSASQAVQGAAQTAQEYAGQASDMAKEQYGKAQEMVRQRPAESAIVCFGTGLLLGVVVGLLARSK
ncbi:MAG: CsbD family protein [Bythopirellula sp.]|nr:CsbD family protein [Bythopirellula sp.]